MPPRQFLIIQTASIPEVQNIFDKDSSSKFSLQKTIYSLLFTLTIISGGAQVTSVNDEHEWLNLSSNREAQQDLGWKVKARWQYDQNRYQNPDASTAYESWRNGIHHFQQQKIVLKSKQRTTTWLPVGPTSAPLPNNSQYISGTGRINTITFHPTDPNIIWVGGGQGGIWKTTNGAKSWMPIGDDLPVMRISDIALNPNDPDEMYLSLGDYAYIGFGLTQNDRKRNFHFGLGVYKSTNGGADWQPTGLMRDLESQDLSLTRRVFVNKSNDNIILAAGTQGIWRSENRGAQFEQVNARMYWDIEQDPVNEDILYASTAFIRTIDSDRSALWKSTDFGKTWKKLNTGIPEVDTVQRMEIAISPIDPEIVYLVAADIQGGLYGVYRSLDAGETWEKRADTPNILHWSDGSRAGGQGNYDLAILADPNEIDRVYVSGVNHWVSTDGGANWSGASHWVASHGPSVHADHHFLAYNPLDQFYYLCHDGGVSRTRLPEAGSWSLANADEAYEWPTAWEHLNDGMANMSFYRLGLGTGQQIDIFAGAQDLGTFLRRNGQWTYNILGDGMECIIHPENPSIIYGSTQFGSIHRSDDGGATFNRIGVNQPNWESEFASWTTPYKLDPIDPETIYVPAGNVWLSKDGGNQFTQKSDFENLFPITGFAVAKSDPKVMYVGKRVWYSLEQPGQAFRTTDGGTTWRDITDGIPKDLIINYIEVDDDDPLHVWIVFGSFQNGAKVFESFNGGEAWANITFNLPNLPANCIRHHGGALDVKDPIYLGMDRGVYYKTADQDHWDLYGADLPNVVISELEIHEGSQQLFAATFGRGIWRAPLMDKIVTRAQANFLKRGIVKINPNPNDGQFEVQIHHVAPGTYQCEIIDVTGTTHYREKCTIRNEHFSVTPDVSLLSGIYYFQVSSGLVQHSLKFMIVD